MHIPEEMKSCFAPVQHLIDRVLRDQTLRRAHHSSSPSLDLFCGLEYVIRCELEQVYFPRFLCSMSYRELVHAIIDRNQPSMNDILNDCEPFQNFLHNEFPQAAGLVKFYHEVQKSYLEPLEERGHHADLGPVIRRIYNHHLTEFSDRHESLLLKVIDRETRARVLTKYQTCRRADPADQAYASIFHEAQERVVEWLRIQTLPGFQLTSEYFKWIIQCENQEQPRGRAMLRWTSKSRYKKDDHKHQKVLRHPQVDWQSSETNVPDQLPVDVNISLLFQRLDTQVRGV